MKKRFYSGALRVLKPGEFDVITRGYGKPGKGLPSKCLHCCKPIKAGEAWRSHFNGEYTIISHLACEVKPNASA